MRDTLLRHRLAVFAAHAAIFACALALASCGSSGHTFTTPTALTKCAVAFDPAASTLPAAGGTAAVTVNTERECQWTATSDAGWLSIKSGASGQGPGTVQFAAAANIDPVVRSGSLVVNDGRVQVTQAAGECSFQLAQSSASFPQAGGSGSVDVRASSALCQWSARADVDWIALTSAASEKGSAAIAFSVSPTSGPPRTGTLTVAGLPFTVIESAGCTYGVSPLSVTVDPSGGARTITVSTAAGCPWTAAAQDAWITLTAGATGAGSGSVAFTVAATDGPSRTGTLSVAGQAVTIVQSQGCSFAIAPSTASVPSSGGSQTVAVSAGAGCGWTAQSNISWITVASGASGSGDGAVALSVDSTSGPARSGTVTIAGQVFTVNQGQGCTFSLSAGSASAPAAGASGSFDVRTASGCAWTAASGVDWLHITAGATGSGPGTVQYSVTANTGPARSATITAGDQSFTVAQDGGCSFSIAPTNHNSPSGGDTTSTAVTAPPGCAWTAASSAPWIGIASGSSGTGNGGVQIVVAANTGSDRSGAAIIAGQTFTIMQASGCTATVTPDTIAQPAAAGTQNVTVATDASCSWTAVSNAPWITIPGTSGGAGNATVPLAIGANSGVARSGTATIAGHTVTVNQDSGCTFTLAPTSQDVAQAGGTGTFSVTTDASCAWTASSGASWIVVTGGASGTGGGSVQFTVDANTTGATRSAAIAIGGQAFTVNQAASEDVLNVHTENQLHSRRLFVLNARKSH